MSLKNVVGVVAFGSAVALALYGVGCGGSSGGGTAGSGGSTGSGSGGSTGSGTGGTTGSGGSTGSGHGGSGGGGGSGGSPFGDSGTDGGAMCAPGSLAGFTPALNASAVTAGMCTNADIVEIVDACFSSEAGATACMTLEGTPAIKTCIQSCIVTNWTANTTTDWTYTSGAAWGGLLEVQWPVSMTSFGYADYLNYGGCLAAAAPSDPQAQKCATDNEELLECLLDACMTSCPIPVVPSGEAPDKDAAWVKASNAQDACINAAVTGGCATYETAVTTDCGEADGIYQPDSGTGEVAQCNSALNIFTNTMITPTNAQYEQAYTDYLEIICGMGTGG